MTRVFLNRERFLDDSNIGLSNLFSQSGITFDFSDILLAQASKFSSTPSVNGAIEPKTLLDFWLLAPRCDYKIDLEEHSVPDDESINKYEPTNNLLVARKGGAWFTLIMFKRSGEKLFALNRYSSLYEADDSTCILAYRNKKWINISTQIIPGYDPKCIYELSEIGTTISVYNRVVSTTAMEVYHEEGEKLYELIWKSDFFVPTEDVRTQANTCKSTVR